MILRHKHITVTLGQPANDVGMQSAHYKEVELPRPRFAFSVIEEKPVINTRELVSIRSLTAYVAHNQNVREETVRKLVSAQFSIPGIEALHRSDYDAAIRFLVDLRVQLEVC